MKSFSDFAKKTQVSQSKITRDKFYKNEVYKKGEWVLTENNQVGKILRRGPNYVLCLTAEETTFRTWIKDIKEVFELGTDAYREYLQAMTPGEKIQKPPGTVPVHQVIPTDPKKDKMDHHEEKTLAQAAAEAITANARIPGPLSDEKIQKEWRFDYSGKMANKDIKGLGADGVGGGDAPGMKLAEPKGEEGKPDVKKVKHSCVTKVEHPEWGAGNCLSEMHTLDEEGNVSHYDIMFEHGLEKAVPAESFEVVKEVVHEHATNPAAKQDEVNTDLPAGPHGTVYVEPPVKSEDYTKAYGDKKSVHKQVKRNEIVGEKRSFKDFRTIAEKK